MQDIIGNRLLKQLKPKDKPYEVRDQQIKGFLVRVQPSGSMTYIMQYRRGQRITLGRVGVLKPAEARDEAKKILGEIMRGEDPGAAEVPKSKKHSLSTFLADDYEPWAIVHQKTATATLARIRTTFAKFLNVSLNEIAPHAIERWRTKRLNDGRKASTVNRDLVSLKAALAKAVEWGFIEVHPIAMVKSSKVDSNTQPRYLTKEEITNLITALDQREERIRTERANANKWRSKRGIPLLPDLTKRTYADHLKPMVLLSLYTGMRRGELFNLTWEDVNFERALLTIQGGGAKSGKTRHIPLNDQAKTILIEWQQQTPRANKLIFTGKKGGRFDNVNTSWKELLKTAKIQKFRWHDLRHTFASWLVMQSVDLNTVRELLGHSDLKMTLRYAHLGPEHTALAVGRLSF